MALFSTFVENVAVNKTLCLPGIYTVVRVNKLAANV